MVKVRLDPIITNFRILIGKKHPKKTPVLTKSMNADIWVVGTSKQLFLKVFILKHNFQKNEIVTVKTPFYVIASFCTLPSMCLNISFCQESFV